MYKTYIHTDSIHEYMRLLQSEASIEIIIRKSNLERIHKGISLRCRIPDLKVFLDNDKEALPPKDNGVSALKPKPFTIELSAKKVREDTSERTTEDTGKAVIGFNTTGLACYVLG